jgi:hypothetical protein
VYRTVENIANQLGIVRAVGQDDVGCTGLAEPEQLAPIGVAPDHQRCQRISLGKAEDSERAVFA